VTTGSFLPPPAGKLVGIARLAAESESVRQRPDAEYFALEARTILNRESSGRMPFAWTVNPYRGCEFGCKYCYARYTHEFMEMRDGLDFERRIYAKLGAPALLRDELLRARDHGLPIALGTATDPYQPAEKHLCITRRMLDVLAGFEGLQLSITTKGVLILRDLDLLQRVCAKNVLRVHMTVTTTSERMARLLEPKAPPPAKRLAAVAKLVGAGIHAGVLAAPVLPGLTDSARNLDRLAQQAAAAGARFFGVSPLFLMPSAMKQFMPFLEGRFPHLVPRYRKLYGRSAYVPEGYKRELAKLAAATKARYGFHDAPPTRDRETQSPQLALALQGSLSMAAESR
jgi:DNA repair photolyase